MQMSLITHNEHEYYLRSKTDEATKQMLKTLSLKEMPDLIPKSAINQYI